ncbi:MAG: phage terminase small subunit P27 family [Proteobacteria bacterium]|nr:phage terminase small subunit P27 family [Pseudomonadota bacterium]
MSTRGRKAELRVIEGGLGEAPEIPQHIPAEMHAEWSAVVGDLTARKLLTDSMLGSVEAYIMALSNMRLAQKALDDHGPLVQGERGGLKQNPAVSLLGKSQSAVQRLSAELGLTPASRSKQGMGSGSNAEDGEHERTLFDL